MSRRLADVPAGSVDALQQRLQTVAKDFVIVRASEPALRAKLHILYTASRAGQPCQFVGKLSDVMADERLQDRGEIQLLLFDEVLMFGTSLTQMHFLFLTGHDVGQMNRGWTGAALAFHGAFLREGPALLPYGVSTPLRA